MPVVEVDRFDTFNASLIKKVSKFLFFIEQRMPDQNINICLNRADIYVE